MPLLSPTHLTSYAEGLLWALRTSPALLFTNGGQMPAQHNPAPTPLAQRRRMV